MSPYFIWLNVNPFRRAGSITMAVPRPGGAAELAQADSSLRAARAAVAQARRDAVGIYQAADPLRVLPFELRFLARRQPPDRWLVDLSSDAEVLLPRTPTPTSRFRRTGCSSRPSTCRCGSTTAGSAGRAGYHQIEQGCASHPAGVDPEGVSKNSFWRGWRARGSPAPTSRG